MAISKQKKSEVLDKLKGIAKDSASVVFVNFHGLPVGQATEIRRTLRGKNVGYTVAKKSLTRKALSESTITGDMPELPGELGIAFGADLLDPAHEIYEFEKKFDKKISIVGGVFEGRFMNQAEMISVASIPGMQTLKAQFVNLINSPIQRFVIALNAIAEKKS